MKPSDRFEHFMYVIELVAFILLASVVFLPPSVLPQWARYDPDLRYFGWFALTALCMLAIGVSRGWANRRKNKWLLLLTVPPGAVLAYEVLFFLKVVAVGVIREWRELLPFLWIALALYLWMRGNMYKEHAQNAVEVARQVAGHQPKCCPHCGASLGASV